VVKREGLALRNTRLQGSSRTLRAESDTRATDDDWTSNVKCFVLGFTPEVLRRMGELRLATASNAAGSLPCPVRQHCQTLSFDRDTPCLA
jgi:hypothetical protein